MKHWAFHLNVLFPTWICRHFCKKLINHLILLPLSLIYENTSLIISIKNPVMIFFEMQRLMQEKKSRHLIKFFHMTIGHNNLIKKSQCFVRNTYLQMRISLLTKNYSFRIKWIRCRAQFNEFQWTNELKVISGNQEHKKFKLIKRIMILISFRVFMKKAINDFNKKMRTCEESSCD